MSVEMFFSCPNCGDPSAETTTTEVDIHSGATYECRLCGKAVIFTAQTPEQYSQSSLAAAPSGGARLESAWQDAIASIQNAHDGAVKICQSEPTGSSLELLWRGKQIAYETVLAMLKRLSPPTPTPQPKETH